MSFPGASLLHQCPVLVPGIGGGRESMLAPAPGLTIPGGRGLLRRIVGRGGRQVRSRSHGIVGVEDLVAVATNSSVDIGRQRSILDIVLCLAIGAAGFHLRIIGFSALEALPNLVFGQAL